jgi:hypothetical protein
MKIMKIMKKELNQYISRKQTSRLKTEKIKYGYLNIRDIFISQYI